MEVLQEVLFGSFNAGSLTIDKCYNNSLVNGSGNAGGMVGYAYLPSINMINCGNNSNAVIQGESYAGGLFGRQGNRGSIYIYNSYVLGTVKGNNYIGGFCGNGHTTGGGALGYTKIENSYFAGKVEGGKNIGGIIGGIGSKNNLENISFINCYYINSIDKAISNLEKEGITALSKENMKVNNTLFNNLKSYTNSGNELLEWKKDENQYPVHSN